MHHVMRALCLIAVLGFAIVPAEAGDDTWTGTWVTDEGAMRLEQKGNAIEGDYGKGGRIEGEITDGQVSGTYQIGNVTGKILWDLDESKGAFKGEWIHPSGNKGTWRGWKQDPKAESKPAANFGGYWLTTIGTFQLEQKGSSASGPWRHQGWSTIKGSVKGARFNGKLMTPRWKGSVWLEMTADGKRVYGLTDEKPPAVVQGVLVEGFESDPKLKAGEIAQGRAENGMLYFVRPPDGWKKGKRVDAIILLHGSNWTTKGMVWVTAKNWPDIAKNYMLIGLQGETWSKYSEPPDFRHNYTYVNWMGNSTYKGYPYTHRESPQLVADVTEELSEKYGWKRTFIGGHSQGGFLTFLMYMHFPELYAGAFPVAGGMVIQAEPDVFKDKKLMKAQRAMPLAIVHGTQDNVVSYSTGQYIRDRYDGSGFPLMKLINPEMGHPYDFLPIGDAIEYLDALSTTDTKVLVDYANKAAKAKDWATVSAALVRADAIKARKKLAAAEKKLDKQAKKDAERYAELLKKGEGGDWVDEFTTWRRLYYGAPCAAAAMKAYAKLKKKHDERAEELVNEARAAFRKRDQATGKAKWQEVVDDYWASGRYPLVRRWIDENK